MSWATGVLVFVVIWWTVIFAVLPLGVQRAADDVAGADRGAPARPQLKRKALITTAISVALWLVWFCVWVLDVFGIKGDR
jgi:predicted secreted protein